MVHFFVPPVAMGNKPGQSRGRKTTIYFVACTTSERDDIYTKIVRIIHKNSILDETSSVTGHVFSIDITENERTLLNRVGIISLTGSFAIKLI